MKMDKVEKLKKLKSLLDEAWDLAYQIECETEGGEEKEIFDRVGMHLNACGNRVREALEKDKETKLNIQGHERRWSSYVNTSHHIATIEQDIGRLNLYRRQREGS